MLLASELASQLAGAQQYQQVAGYKIFLLIIAANATTEQRDTLPHRSRRELQAAPQVHITPTR